MPLAPIRNSSSIFGVRETGNEQEILFLITEYEIVDARIYYLILRFKEKPIDLKSTEISCLCCLCSSLLK